MRIERPLIPALVLCLVSCAEFHSIPLSAEGGHGSFTGRSFADPGLRDFLLNQKAGGGSWNVDRIALAGAYFQGDVAVARAEAEEAAAAIQTAGQMPNPVLSFSPGYNTSSKGISPWIVAPSLDVTIETAGKRCQRVAAARARAEAAQLRVAAAAWDTRTKVRKTMLELYAAGENAALLRTEVALHQRGVERLLAQVNAGESPGFELTQQRLGLSRAKLALHDAEIQAATARTQLASAVGVPTTALDGVPLDFSAFRSLPATPGSQPRRRALTHRADLLARLADYAAADAELRLQIAKQYPDIHLGPGYEFDQGDDKWSLGIGIELPILSQNRGPIAEAEAKRKTAAAKFNAKQQAVFGEIETALASYRGASAKVATATRLADESSRARSTTKSMVDAGELAPLELIRRDIEAATAELSLLEARIQAQQAAGELEAALQHPLH